MFIDGRTFVEGVSILPRASHVELAPGREPRQATYWDPRPAAGTVLHPDPDRPRELRSLLVSALERDLDPRGGNLITLSGGVDSCSLAALAGGTLALPVSSWSLIPSFDPERSRELSYMDPIVRAASIAPALRRESSAERYARWLEEAPGLPCQVAHPALCDLPKVAAEHDVRVLFGGDFADQVCGHWVRITDWARETTAAQLITRRHLLPFGRRDYVRWARRRLMDLVGRPSIPLWSYLPPWTRQEVAEEYREWLRRYRRAEGRDRRPLKELAEHAAADMWVAINWEATTAVGVRRSFPFWSREMLEFAFRCHPHELLGPGPKRLLRSALRDDVPARNLNRPDKAAWGRRNFEPVPQIDPELPPGAERLVRPDWKPPPPEDTTAEGVGELRTALRVVRYLNAAGRPLAPSAT
jgi:asparagine synthetase B (glutamine-hydrolysing)